jgi:hypothetical protein
LESHLLTKTLAEKIGNYVEQYIEAMEKVIKYSYVQLSFYTIEFSIYSILCALFLPRRGNYPCFM